MIVRQTRRGFLTAAVGFTSAVPLLSCLPACALQHTPQPRPSPNAPTNPNVPGGMNNLPSERPVDLPVPTINADLLTNMVQELYLLAGELKQETDRTNLRNTLPVDFIPRAQQIEKLAKTIRNKARG